MKLNLFFPILLSLSVTVGCNSKQEIGDLEPNAIPKDGSSVESKWGYVDKDGKIIIPHKYDYAWNFSEGMAMVQLDDYIDCTRRTKLGFIDKTGKVIIPLKYSDIGIFSEGLANVRVEDSQFNGKFGFIDKTGKEVIPIKYGYAYKFSEGLAAVKMGDKWGFINKADEFIIPAKYDEANSFSDGLAAVKMGDKWGFINKADEFIIPAKYDGADLFSDGLAKVFLNNKIQYIDKTGALELCKSPQLFYYLKRINNYQSKLNKFSISSKSFTINRPYLVIEADGSKCEDISFSIYSEKNFNKGFFTELKTLIVQYAYPDFTQSYKHSDTGEIEELTSYGLYIVYFNMATKECIGYDNIRGPSLPSHALPHFIDVSNVVPFWDMSHKIESHLTTSQ